MSTMVLEVYDALKEAGASEASARRAAEAVLQGDSSRLDGIDERLDRIEKRFDVVDKRFDKVDSRFDKIDARFERTDQILARLDARGTTQNWMISACVTLIVLVLGKLLLTH